MPGANLWKMTKSGIGVSNTTKVWGHLLQLKPRSISLTLSSTTVLCDGNQRRKMANVLIWHLRRKRPMRGRTGS
eukprot:scaffold23582_cov73-Skeletonema_marinoi.AAC.1